MTRFLFPECPRSKDRMERFACPTPDFRGRYVSITNSLPLLMLCLYTNWPRCLSRNTLHNMFC